MSFIFLFVIKYYVYNMGCNVYECNCCYEVAHIKFRQIMGCNKSLLIIINASKYKSSIVNPEIMPKAI